LNVLLISSRYVIVIYYCYFPRRNKQIWYYFSVRLVLYQHTY